MEKRKLEINEENVRLDKFIMNSISDLSRTLIQEYIKEGHVLVNGKIEKASYKIKMNDAIEITIPDNKAVSYTHLDVYKRQVSVSLLQMMILKKSKKLF